MTPTYSVRSIALRLVAAFAAVLAAFLVAYAVMVSLVTGDDSANRYEALKFGILFVLAGLLPFGALLASLAGPISRVASTASTGSGVLSRDGNVLYAAPRRAAVTSVAMGVVVLAVGYAPGAEASSWRTAAAHIGAVNAMLASLVFYAAVRSALRPIVETFRPDRETDEDLMAAVRPPIDRVPLRVAFAVAIPASAAALVGTVLVFAHVDAVDNEQRAASAESYNLALSVERRPGEREGGVDGAAEILRIAGVDVERGIRDWVVSGTRTGGATGRPTFVAIPIAIAVAALALIMGRRIGHAASRDLEEAARRMTVVEIADIRSVTQRIARPRSIPEIRQMGSALDQLASTLIRMADDQRRAVDARAETARLRSFLLASVSHDLRGPLNSVLGFADLLLSGVEGELSAAQRESLDALARGGRDLLRLVDDLLDHARLDVGRLSVERNLVEVDRILERARTDALERTRNAASRMAMSIEVEGESALMAYADEERIGHALGALAAFAMMRPGGDGRCWLRVRRQRASVEFTIRGGGSTPSRDALAKLFDPFDFAPTGARAPAGLNLAVSVARGVVSMHGGSAEAEPHETSGIELRVVIPAPARPLTLPPGMVQARAQA